MRTRGNNRGSVGLAAGFGLALGIALVGAGPGAVRAESVTKPIGTLAVKSWDIKADIFYDTIVVKRQDCDIGYTFTYKRKGKVPKPGDPALAPIKFRLRLTVKYYGRSHDANRTVKTILRKVITPWHTSTKIGKTSASGRVPTWQCWVKTVRGLQQATFEIKRAPPAGPAGGRELLGRVVYNKWGASNDVYYRRITVWRQGCQLFYQFLYKRRTKTRRRLRFEVEFDNEKITVPWHASRELGWRHISGTVQTPKCWIANTQRLKKAQFLSERY